MVKIEIFGGKREIGGNCVKITDKDKTVLFDQGIKFSTFKAFYSRFIQPTGIPELRKLGIIPPPEAYENVNTIYISHFHLDHLGLLSNIPCETVVKLPSLRIYQALETAWRMSPSWTAFIPPKFFVSMQEVTKYREDENNVLSIPVSHSAYPAYAFIFFGSDETILYTGDFRVSNVKAANKVLYRQTLLNYLEENTDIKIDKLIIEGTNIGRPQIPIKPDEAQRIINRLLVKGKLALIAMHELDIESLLLIASIASVKRKNLTLASPRLARVLDTLFSIMPKLKRMFEEMVLVEEIKENTTLNKISMNEITKSPNSYCIITDIARLDEILRKFEPLSNHMIMAPVILMISEPASEEAMFETERLLKWLSLYGLQPYNIRISGHYHPYELKTIIQKINPREIIPIHTLFPEFLHA